MPHALIVDDDPSAQMLFRAVLRTCGVESTVVDDGERALAAMRRTRYDAVILDLLLPKANGFEILRELKCTAPATLARVIVCTAMAEPVLEDCVELPLVHGVLFKPVDVRTLAGAVQKLVHAESPGTRAHPPSEGDAHANARPESPSREGY